MRRDGQRDTIGVGTWPATVLLGLALVCGTQAPAAGWQQPAVSVGLDGQHWAPSLTAPLFDASRQWVPGDSETVTVWLRNLSGDDADLDLQLLTDDKSWPADELTLTARVGGEPLKVATSTTTSTTTSAKTSTATATTATTGGAARRIPATTAPVPVDVTLSMPAGTRRHQGQQVALRLQVRLTTVGASSTTSSIGTADRGRDAQVLLPGLSEPVAGHVPGAGAPPFGLPLAFVAAAAAAVAAVRAAVATRRRRLLARPPVQTGDQARFDHHDEDAAP